MGKKERVALTKHINEISILVKTANVSFEVWKLLKEDKSKLRSQLDLRRALIVMSFTTVIVTLYKIVETGSKVYNLQKLFDEIAIYDLPAEISSLFQLAQNNSSEIKKAICILRSNHFAHKNIDLEYSRMFAMADITADALKQFIDELINLMCVIGQHMEMKGYDQALFSSEAAKCLSEMISTQELSDKSALEAEWS